MLSRRSFALTLAAAALPAWAKPKQMRIVVPYPAGGPLDACSRLLADKLKTKLGRIIVENRPGAAGARGMFPEIDQPGMGKLQITAMAQKLTRTKSCPRKGAPLLGEDNAAIYGEMLGFDEAKLAELKEKGVI